MRIEEELLRISGDVRAHMDEVSEGEVDITWGAWVIDLPRRITRCAMRVRKETIAIPTLSDGSALSLGQTAYRGGDRVVVTGFRVTRRTLSLPPCYEACVMTQGCTESWCDPSELSLEPETAAGRLREWVRRARADEHMDLRELDAIADEIDGDAS